jgi:ABC-type spermidine/putrescine transport system permease subunit II
MTAIVAMPTIAIAVFIIVVIFIGTPLLVWASTSFEAARRNTHLKPQMTKCFQKIWRQSSRHAVSLSMIWTS